MQMEDHEYESYLDRCQRLKILLDEAVTFLMHFVFEGRARNPDEWEMLFTALSQAAFMKHFLSIHCSNLCTIAEDFLAQLDDWKQDVHERLK